MMSFVAVILARQTLIRRVTIIMGVVVLLTHFLSSNESLQQQARYVFVAIFMMLLISQVIASLTITESFVTVVLDYISYFSDLTNRVADSESTRPIVDFSSDHSLRQKSEWVFAPGFSPGLRAGFRSYLLQIERTVELLHHLERSVECIKPDHELYACFISCMSVNKELLHLLRAFFEGRGMQHDDTVDWMRDLQLLEQLIEKRCPSIARAVHIHARDLQLIDVMYACKELRQVLLQLAMALPEKLK